jgi:hypothetical protein
MFYLFSQNNSGGKFHIDERIAHYVIIEANSADEANQIAESKGIYFDGVHDGRDCGCCGDRWYPAWSAGTEEPMIYDQKPQEFKDMFARSGEPYCHIYLLDGLQKTYRAPERGRLSSERKRLK